MSHAEFTPTTNEFIGTAAGHTIGMVIPNIDPEVRTLLKIPEQYSSLGILTSRTGAAAQAQKPAKVPFVRLGIPPGQPGADIAFFRF